MKPSHLSSDRMEARADCHWLNKVCCFLRRQSEAKWDTPSFHCFCFRTRCTFNFCHCCSNKNNIYTRITTSHRSTLHIGMYIHTSVAETITSHNHYIDMQHLKTVFTEEYGGLIQIKISSYSAAETQYHENPSDEEATNSPHTHARTHTLNPSAQTIYKIRFKVGHQVWLNVKYGHSCSFSWVVVLNNGQKTVFPVYEVTSRLTFDL